MPVRVAVGCPLDEATAFYLYWARADACPLMSTASMSLSHPQVARALNQNAPSLNTVQRGYGWTPEQMFIREFNWRLSQEELEGGIEIYDRTVIYCFV